MSDRPRNRRMTLAIAAAVLGAGAVVFLFLHERPDEHAERAPPRSEQPRPPAPPAKGIELRPPAPAGERGPRTPRIGEWVITKETIRVPEREIVLYMYRWVVQVKERTDEHGETLVCMEQKLTPDLARGEGPAQQRREWRSPAVDSVDAAAEEIEVHGRRLRCVKEPFPDGSSDTWLCPEIPVDGRVRVVTRERPTKMVNGGTIKELASTSELLDWGDSGGAEKPLR